MERTYFSASVSSALSRDWVLGAALDASHHAGQLVEGGNHDDGKVAEGGIALDLDQGPVAVKHRHHQVEQDEIEGFGAQALERGASVLRRRHRMALAFELAGQHVPVALVVVDHQDPAGRGGRRRLPFAGRRRLGPLGARGGRGGRDHVASQGQPVVGQIQVDQLEQALGGAVDPLQVRLVGVVAGVGRLLHQQLAVADDLVDRRAQVVAQVRKRGARLGGRRGGHRARRVRRPQAGGWMNRSIFGSSRARSIGLVS